MTALPRLAPLGVIALLLILWLAAKCSLVVDVNPPVRELSRFVEDRMAKCMVAIPLMVLKSVPRYTAAAENLVLAMILPAALLVRASATPQFPTPLPVPTFLECGRQCRLPTAAGLPRPNRHYVALPLIVPPS